MDGVTERLYHEIMCPTLTKTGPCNCQPVIVAEMPTPDPAVVPPLDALLIQLGALVVRLRHPHARFREAPAGLDAVSSATVDNWADELKALVAALRAHLVADSAIDPVVGAKHSASTRDESSFSSSTSEGAGVRAGAPAWHPIESAPKDGTWVLLGDQARQQGDTRRHPMTPNDALKAADAALARAERMLKIAQVARMANVSERTVWRDIKAGHLVVVYQRPRRPRVHIAIARAYAKNNVTTSDS